MNYLIVDKLIKNALIEDINYGDITTDNLLLGSEVSKGKFIAKDSGVIAGIDVAKRVFEIVDSSIRFKIKVEDSSKVEKGNVIVELEGNSKSILKGERVALNILQRMCGIATKTNKMVDLVKDYDVKIVDTRKTLPGFRILDKYSVTAGGGYNHRLNLSDFVMIKDNHIRAVGSITEAVKRIKNKIPFTAKVEVEVENLDQLKEAVNTEVDVIMLDNMDVDTMKKAVKFVDKKFILEASGNVTEDTIVDIASTGVDIISIGSLTHSVKAMDISLRFI
ncbi:carboxylating nicotinate-nucleotide diphosphorylase [Clostridium ljungdahlii]|uniref:Probable nicotinate-nucleotide pyrophosphorylase [carboxylating] n=1 Tax=Clostridium ljungdahlii TaxID=1538 RepID=A0A168M1F3_9CLOT|nr:carboxylating nicotinate-nucleotide diphosphorylase [Clostridium ljungdahlii]OAA83979.1 putative nicotinate-nucleotide pyrophosphorylase [carboxylating] [Clostridium ljungdahlii]